MYDLSRLAGESQGIYVMVCRIVGLVGGGRAFLCPVAVGAARAMVDVDLVGDTARGAVRSVRKILNAYS